MWQSGEKAELCAEARRRGGAEARRLHPFARLLPLPSPTAT